MWYLNKGTGKKWDITDPGVLKRVQSDNNFELIVEKPKPKKRKQTPKEVNKNA